MVKTLIFNLLIQFNYDPENDFLSPEIMAIYRYAMTMEPRFKIIQIYGFASDHPRLCFPDMVFSINNKSFEYSIFVTNFAKESVIMRK